VTAQSSEVSLELSIAALAGRIRAAVAEEVPELELSHVYRRAARLPRAPHDPFVERLIDEPGGHLRQPDTRPPTVRTPQPATTPRARPARRPTRRRVQARLEGGSRLWQWSLLPAVMIGLAVPYLWTQIAALTVVAFTVTNLASAAFDE
jgi:hypothetical protein